MSEKLERILDLVSEYINEKDTDWNRDEDWVAYSGPHFSDKEYRAAHCQPRLFAGVGFC